MWVCDRDSHVLVPVEACLAFLLLSASNCQLSDKQEIKRTTSLSSSFDSHALCDLCCHWTNHFQISGIPTWSYWHIFKKITENWDRVWIMSKNWPGRKGAPSKKTWQPTRSHRIRQSVTKRSSCAWEWQEAKTLCMGMPFYTCFYLFFDNFVYVYKYLGHMQLRSSPSLHDGVFL